jgi:TRAP-type transport system periplasmic protein
MKLFKKMSIAGLILVLLMTIAITATISSFAQEKVTLVLETMLPEEHVYYRTLEYFAEKVDEYYDGPIEFELHHSADLGTEKDAFEYMMQGVSIDVSIISPAWMATWDEASPFMDAPFLFKNEAAWKESMDQEVFKPIADNLTEKGVRIIGYGGGSPRNLIVNKPVWRTADLPEVEMRVQGSPLHQEAFDAVGVKATPLDYTQVYNAIKTGVLDALENEPAGMAAMKFYEVAPYYVLTNHQMTVRVLCISEKRFQSFPKELQEAILKAGTEASAFHHMTEIGENEKILEELVENGQLKVIKFYNTEIRNRALPVVEKYAEKLGVADIMKSINKINDKH